MQRLLSVFIAMICFGGAMLSSANHAAALSCASSGKHPYKTAFENAEILILVEYFAFDDTQTQCLSADREVLYGVDVCARNEFVRDEVTRQKSRNAFQFMPVYNARILDVFKSGNSNERNAQITGKLVAGQNISIARTHWMISPRNFIDEDRKEIKPYRAIVAPVYREDLGLFVSNSDCSVLPIYERALNKDEFESRLNQIRDVIEEMNKKAE